MYWNREITVEKLRKLADDVEAGAVRVQSVEYKSDDYGAGSTATLQLRIVEVLKPKEPEEQKQA